MPAMPTLKHTPKLGAKIRALRRQEGLSQVQLAERLAISPSYLNLIESNKRPLTAPLLIHLAQSFHLDLKTFAPEEDQRLEQDLMETFGDPLFESLDLPASEVRDLTQNCPALAQAVFRLYQTYREARRRMDTLSDRLSDGQGVDLQVAPLPAEAAGDFIQRAMNHFPLLEEAAEKLWQDASLDHDLLYPGLVGAFQKLGIRVCIHSAQEAPGILRRYDANTRLLSVSELLPLRSRTFQLAHQWALVAQGGLLNELTQDRLLPDLEAKAMTRVALANYFAGAVLMPYAPFLRDARAERY